MRKNICVRFLLALLLAPVFVVDFACAAVYDSRNETVIFAEVTGKFFGDGREAKVELVGEGMQYYDFTADRRPESARNSEDNNETIYLDENGKIEDGVSIGCMGYYLRVTAPGAQAARYDFTVWTSLDRELKLCDLDGDGTPEIFIRYATGTSAGIENVVVVSLKDGKYRELFNMENANPIPLVLEAKRYPGFFIQFKVRSEKIEKQGLVRTSMMLDLNNDTELKKAYSRYIFNHDGSPAEYVYEPNIDDGFRYPGVTDLDDDGHDEIYGAIPVNGSSNADDIAYINVAYKWKNDDWQICFISITDAGNPLGDMPGVLKNP